jgi:phosphatidylserine synthase
MNSKMKDSTLFTLFLSGGFGVIITYIFLYFSNTLNILANYYTKQEWRFWTVSMLVTAASVVGLIVWFSFYQELEGWQRDLFISGLTVFLAFAMIWSFSVFYIHKYNLHPNYQRPILLIVGLATVAMLIATVYSTDKWLVITAAAIVVWHHLIIDGFWWPMLHQRGYQASVRHKKVRVS